MNRDKISFEDERKISYPLYDIEFDTGKLISPMIYTVKDWEYKYSITTYYENVMKERIELWRKIYSILFDKRIKGDYDDFFDMEKQDVEELIEPTQKLIEEIENLIQN